MMENNDTCQVWRSLIERLSQGIRDFQDLLDSGEAPPGMEERIRRQIERLERELTHARHELERCEQEAERASETF